jgi:lipopolysaccharide/colanic/teichoic acid biosynthesis glycosyltransferase
MHKELEIKSAHPYLSETVRPSIEGRGVYYTLKRMGDLFLASLLLLALLPVMLLIAIAIFVYSPGPIFFLQERVGARRIRMGKTYFWKQENFHCYKFRTMKHHADSSVHKDYVQALIRNDQNKMSAIQGKDTKIRKLLNDSRIIRPGVFLRKFSLDELPQLWNVILGDMSMIGPRPAIPYEVELYEPWYYRRLEAQPGITGLQQVKVRCITDFETQVKYDIEYVDNQSLWLDIKIALQTPLAVISGRGAG